MVCLCLTLLYTQYITSKVSNPRSLHVVSRKEILDVYMFVWNFLKLQG